MAWAVGHHHHPRRRPPRPSWPPASGSAAAGHEGVGGAGPAAQRPPCGETRGDGQDGSREVDEQDGRVACGRPAGPAHQNALGDHQRRLVGGVDEEGETGRPHDRRPSGERREVGVVAEPERGDREAHEGLVQSAGPPGGLGAQQPGEEQGGEHERRQQQSPQCPRALGGSGACQRYPPAFAQPHGDERSQGEEEQGLEVDVVGAADTDVEQPQGRERQERGRLQGAHHDPQERRDEHAEQERLQEPQWIRDRAHQQHLEKRGRRESLERPGRHVARVEGQGVEGDVQGDTPRAPEQEGDRQRACPSPVLGEELVGRRHQGAEEEEPGDGEQQGGRPARQCLRDEVLHEAHHAGSAGHVRGVLAEARPAAEVVGVHPDDGDDGDPGQQPQLGAQER